MSLRLAFYGDDFTGSTDVLETLTRGGVVAVLFLDPPTAAQLEAFPDAEAVGVAGTSRSWTPEQMTAHLPGMFAALRGLGATHTHYKVCSISSRVATSRASSQAVRSGGTSAPYIPLRRSGKGLGRPDKGPELGSAGQKR